MKVIEKPNNNRLFNAPLLILVIVENQVGVGILQFQRKMAEIAHHDAWISVLIAGIATHIIAWVMLKTLARYDSTDLYGIHYDVYGKWLGSIFSIFYMIYLLLSATVVLRSYVEVVQTWLFPELPTWLLCSLILFLVLYGILGGIRVIVGACFLVFFSTIFLLFILAYNLPYAEWRSLFPIMESGVSKLLLGAKQMTLTVIGFEILYFIYPFIKEKKKAPRFAHLGLLTSTLIYFIVMIVSLVFYSQGQLLKTLWPTLTLFKIVQIPFLERFEYVTVSIWMAVILPNLLLYIWAATRGMKRMFAWNQKWTLYLFVFLIFIACNFLTTDLRINAFAKWVNKGSFYFVFVYPLFLYFMVIIRNHRRKKGVE